MKTSCSSRSRVVLSLFTVVLAVGAAAVPALAASVSGRITAGASVEPAPALDVTIDAWTCGKDGKIADPRLVIGPERGLADVVLRLRGEGDAPAWTAPAEAPVMDQKGCVFTPHVVVVGPEQALKVGNSDPTLHNFHTRASENKTINRAQPRGMSFETKFAKPEIQKVVCDVHYWMSAVVVVTDTAWTAVSDENGRFAIADVADGTYDVELWHEELGERAGTVTVGGGDAVFDFTWERTAEESAAGASVAPIAVASCGCRGAMAGGGEDGMACGGGGCGHGMGAGEGGCAGGGCAHGMGAGEGGCAGGGCAHGKAAGEGACSGGGCAHGKAAGEGGCAGGGCAHGMGAGDGSCGGGACGAMAGAGPGKAAGGCGCGAKAAAAAMAAELETGMSEAPAAPAAPAPRAGGCGCGKR